MTRDKSDPAMNSNPVQPKTASGSTLVGILMMILLVQGFLSKPAMARTYFVACSPNASDENSGTSPRPLRSIGVAIRLAIPGDIISVRSGDYRNEDTGYGVGVIPVLKSGTPSEPIRIRSTRNNRAIVRKFLVQNRSDLIIEGFDLRGEDFCDLPGWQAMPTIVRDVNECSERPDFSLPYETRQSQIESEFAVYFDQLDRLGFEIGIDLESCKRIRVVDNLIAGYFAGIQSRGCLDLRLHRNRIQECTNGIFTFYSDDSDAPGLLRSSIRFNQISQCLDNGIDIRAASRWVTIQDNQVSFSGRSHISLQDGTSRCTVLNNALVDGGFYSETMKYPGSSAISLRGVGSRNEVTKNLVRGQVDYTGIDGNGIIVDFAPAGTRNSIRSNVSEHNMGAGLNLTASPGTVVADNVFAFNGDGATERRRGAGIKISRDEDLDNTIVRNLFLGNRAAGILSSDTINQQRLINHNWYFVDSEPLIWDGFNDGDQEYHSLEEVQLYTNWESRGYQFGIIDLSKRRD